MSISGDQARMQRTEEQVRIRTQDVQTQQEQQPVQAGPVQGEEQPLQREREANRQLVQEAREQLPAAQADGAAPGAPVQEEAPPQRTWKQKASDKWHARKARKACPVGTAATYDMVHSLQWLRQGQDTALEGHLEEIQNSGVEMPLLRAFVQGWRQDKKGRPATPADAQARAADEAFVADYCSNDLQRRRPHLDRMVSALLSAHLTPGMFHPRHLRGDLARLQRLGEQMACLGSMMADPVNRPYFEENEAAYGPLLRQIRDQVYPAYLAALATTAMSQGVHCSRADYCGRQDVPLIRLGEEHAGERQAVFGNAVEAFALRRRAGLRELALDEGLRWIDSRQCMDLLREDPALNIPARLSELLEGSMALLRKGEAHRAENRRIMAAVLALDRMEEGERPPLALYRELRELLAPRVQQVMDFEPEKLEGLDDTLLILQLQRLGDLYQGSRITARLLDVAHPFHRWRTGPMTLGDDLLGEHWEEYRYKLAMIQGLYEKARGLAGLAWEREAAPGESLEDTEGYAPASVTMGVRRMEEAKRYYRAVKILGTPEFHAWAHRIIEQGVQNAPWGDKFDEVIRELQESQDPEILAAMHRVQHSYYYSLDYSQAEVEALEMKPNLGEALFRSFTSFASTEAAQTLLTPEQFRQMVLDLGAGDQMHKGTWDKMKPVETVDENGETVTKMQLDPQPGTPDEELEQAAARNRQGLAQYKRVVRAHYDMLERRYGDMVENISEAELLEHWQTIDRDFSDAQVTLGMSYRFPGFLNLEDEEDVRLKNQIAYFSLMGNMLIGIVLAVLLGSKLEEALPTALAGVQSGDSGYQEAKAYLLAHSPRFQHQRIDWSQRVQEPQGE